MKNKYAHLSIQEILTHLKTQFSGLSSEDVSTRLKEKGYNELSSKRTSVVRKFIEQYSNFLMALLICGSLVSFVLGEATDGTVILLILLVNGILGTYQEYRAERLAEVLQSHIPQKVRVRRNGAEETIDRKNLVYGDVILLTSGQLVPADACVIDTKGVIVDESILTGESIGVSKELKGIVYSSTLVCDGACEAVVTATASETEFGQIVSFTHHSKKRSFFLKQINELSNFLFKITIFITALLFIALEIFRPELGINHIFLFTVAMAIAIVPEMLPLISTLALTRASLALVKKGVLIKRLSSLEDMGGVEIICTDKTGTLTKNLLSVTDIVSADSERCLAAALVASEEIQNTETFFSGSFDVALWNYATESLQQKAREMKKIFSSSFDFNYKWRFTVSSNDNHNIRLFIKGAPESVLSQCLVSEDDKKKHLEDIKRLGERGLRTLVIAEKKIEVKEEYTSAEVSGLEYLGYVVFEDPVKESASIALARSEELGLKIKIITGDASEVALHVAEKVGMKVLSEEIMLGSDVEEIEESRRYDALKHIKIFARVSPKEKFEIIRVLSLHHAVLFLGEGVNDAPALKSADVGMVVQEASDIAKESADIILTKPDLSVVIEAIYLGRQIMNNISKYILITLTGNFGSLYSLSLISIVSKTLPLLPTQVLLENILTDVPMISTVNSPISKSEESKPVRQHIKDICIASSIFGFAILLIQFVFYNLFSHLPEDLFRTIWLIEIILFEFMLIVSLRTTFWFWKAPPLRPGTSVFFLFVVAFTVLMPFIPYINNAFHLQPFGFEYVFPIVATIISGFIIIEIMKRMVFAKSLR